MRERAKERENIQLEDTLYFQCYILSISDLYGKLIFQFQSLGFLHYLMLFPMEEIGYNKLAFK